MSHDDLKFKIDQLRKDKIIYATEACATTLVCIFGFWFSNTYFSPSLRDFTNITLLLVAVGYTIFMGVGNFSRLQQIQKWEKELDK